MIEYIERLRKEPKEVRQRAVFTWTVVTVGVIALVYFVLRVYLVLPEDTSDTLAAPYERTR